MEKNATTNQMYRIRAKQNLIALWSWNGKGSQDPDNNSEIEYFVQCLNEDRSKN